MTMWLRKSTAFSFMAGPFMNASDGVTANSSITFASANIQVSKNGGNFSNTSAASPSMPHVKDGYYNCPLTATDTGSVGPLRVEFSLGNAVCPVWHDFMVVPEQVYDSLVTGSDWLEVTASNASFNVNAGVLTVKKKDGSTTQFTKSVQTTSNAQQITGTT